MTTATTSATEARAGIATYRDVLALPRVGALSLTGFLVRIPASAAAITVTLHVVLGLGHGYAAAGAVGAANTIGMALGAPLLGRLIDRRGLRPVLVLTTCAEIGFWSAAPWLPYPALLAGALLGGLLALPVYSVIRQAIAALVPTERRRPAYALDSMSVELSYILGPAIGTALAVGVSTTVAMIAVGAGYALGGVALCLLNPPTRAEAPRDVRRETGPIAEWLTPQLVATLLATTAAAAVIFGSELGVVAALQSSGQAGLIGVVIGAWCLSSLVGGYLYGTAQRSRSLYALVAALGLATLPVALGGPWWTFALLLVPAGLACAPSLTASADTVAALAPERVRGLVTGLQGSAITLGAAFGAPLAGALIDAFSPAAAIATAGLVGVAMAGVAALVARR
ncbi:MFS transporter [Pseudonocardia asaccharolytica]|uniref:MFS transporter n=1 Tax=Pseudonocardia asaccharolytica TaxID=54010 RepID=UPI000403D6FD|nr:MFS transporter [Pseudonocardia asaccharolytica]